MLFIVSVYECKSCVLFQRYILPTLKKTFEDKRYYINIIHCHINNIKDNEDIPDNIKKVITSLPFICACDGVNPIKIFNHKMEQDTVIRTSNLSWTVDNVLAFYEEAMGFVKKRIPTYRRLAN